MNTYFQSLYTKYPTKKEFKDKLLDKVIPLRKEYKAFKKKYIDREPSDSWYTQKMTSIRSSYRGIVDLEFLNRKPKPSSKIMDDNALNSITKSVKLITSGQSTDYDSLAIAIGKQFEKRLW
jgi:hypothetical protein